ncbi:FAD-binding oxidoreductase [Nocardiopsis alba]|uniref:FAD-binding oxidoreductase n=1 Tax=Nocardiopsis alba TaxID=53437 RepID=A0ABV5DX14_9ACTN
MSRPTLLTGWGRTSPTAATVVRPRTVEQVAEALTRAGPRGALARGLGRSYGDAAQSAGGLVLDCSSLTGPLRLDTERDEITAPAGIDLRRLTTYLLRHGRVLPVVPGTAHVTLGGAIAADVHGKNHHVDSSLGAHVRSLTLATPLGELLELGPDCGDVDLFHATVGGMGLTGVITSATVAVRPVETSHVMVDIDRTGDLDATLELMGDGPRGHRYTVGWIDLLARGGDTGRGIVTRARHALRTDLPAPLRDEPWRVRPRSAPAAPRWAPSGLLNRWTAQAFNTAYYNAAPRRRRGRIRPLDAFHHPLDAVEGWNRLYGPRGFAQYQFVVPFGEEDTLRAVVEDLARTGAPSFLAVLKRMGDPTPGPLSFPRPGWTLAMDLPVDHPGLARLLRGFDERVLAAGGRLYLAKDGRASAEVVHAMYPELPAWRKVRERVDPGGVLVSDLARRLELV